jgi:hypothetical protein
VGPSALEAPLEFRIVTPAPRTNGSRARSFRIFELPPQIVTFVSNALRLLHGVGTLTSTDVMELRLDLHFVDLLLITAGPAGGVSDVTADLALSLVSNTTTHVPVPTPSFIHVPF